MTINAKWCIQAPFKSSREKDLIYTYFVAWLIITVKTALIIIGSISDSFIYNAMESFYSSDYSLESIIDTSLLILKCVIITTYILFSAFQIGYILETVKRELHGHKFIMPHWEGNYKRFFLNGILFSIILAIYSIPYFILVNVVSMFKDSGSDVASYIEVATSSSFINPISMIFWVLLAFYIIVLPVAINELL